MKSYNEIKEILLRDYPKYFDILDLDMQIRGLFGVEPEKYKEILDGNLDNYIECSKKVANNKGLQNHDWLEQNYKRILNIYDDIKNTYKESDNMTLYERIKTNLSEAVKNISVYEIGQDEYIESLGDIRLDSLGIDIKNIELFKRKDTSNNAPDKLNYLIVADIKWDGDNSVLQPITYNITDNYWEDEPNPAILGVFDEDLDYQIYDGIKEAIENKALSLSQSGKLNESEEDSDKLNKVKEIIDKLMAYLEENGIQAELLDYNYDEPYGMFSYKIDWGDWKHDHAYSEQLVNEFFGEDVSADEEVTEEDGSDTYSAIHNIGFDLDSYLELNETTNK